MISSSSSSATYYYVYELLILFYLVILLLIDVRVSVNTFDFYYEFGLIDDFFWFCKFKLSSPSNENIHFNIINLNICKYVSSASFK